MNQRCRADPLSASTEADLGVDLADLFARNEVKREASRREVSEGGERERQWMEALIRPEITFVVGRSSTPRHRCHRRVSSFIDSTRRRFSRCPIEKPTADASLMPSHRLSASRISPPFIPSLLPSLLRATRMETRFDGSAIRDNRARGVPFDLLERASPV